MKAELQGIKAEAEDELRRIGSPDELETLRVKYLGRKGILSELLAKIPSLPAEQRPEMGRLLNELKKDITSRYEGAKTALLDMQRPKAVGPVQDVTLPGRRPPLGHKHPLIQTIEDIKDIFADMGFQVAFGPEVELEFYNFEALNIPLDHPSRDDFDTFYLKDDVLLRSQTSTVQIRIMEKQRPPIRIIAPGKVFRPDTVDATHSFMFHQIEGLMVEEGVTFGHLKGVLALFAQAYFGPDTRMRFRPSFFPFTEPSAEVEISCSLCKGKGCSTCGSGWMEILGAGMVDPNVFKAVGYDAEKYTGFAFGMGVERIAMLKYGIDDIRLFFENDMRFLSQF
ncbi:MAG: phenylalanine--tRNA ligase subunit alpha [Planctomycetes bacterium GWA2_50_13]|nr:MAG: phenylalanine--tRNA ligase subunit alpha [Planctomycetes bacterium GWA2_50_13]OHB95200.1 MAG: phenylalanine--tRNA ligase subunit alpha [Planctomycetes bacterium RIFCSPLOWO2_02_FULL_50_16]OHC03206.1 MAG: phenylalanine--tRNA ligase subunit alpha [Planctomycetes bacterium RIFCSPLOWO2_12_FULL_50_35]HCN19228.1 phenylalanine--tRNA ligase subunit alpha [Planctomycetia bacterium]